MATQGHKKCATKYCRNSAAKGRTICHKCYQRKFRKAKPKKADYARLRDKARTRKIKFTLTFEQYEDVVKGTRLFNEDGSRNSDYHIDRIDATRGYEEGNLKVLSASDNIAKGNRERTQEYYIYKYYERLYGSVEAEKRMSKEQTIFIEEEFDEERPFG